MDLIYPISYLVSLVSLVMWFFVQGNKTLSRPISSIFLIGFLAYLFGMFVYLYAACLFFVLLVLYRPKTGD